MSRIETAFAQAAEQGRKILVPYIVAGDPAPELTVPMMHELVASGADILEIGVPFSDPMAEGQVIQLAHERALAHAVSLRQILEMVSEFRTRDNRTPVVLMGYANPIERMGYAAFAQQAAAAGVDGVLIVDMPAESAEPLVVELRQHQIDMIFLLAPTSHDARIEAVSRLATGYLYYVSLKGVTGAGTLDVGAVQERVAHIGQFTQLPITVGFGIKDAASACAVAAHAAGVVVGSALVDRALQQVQAQGDAQAALAACDLIRDIRAALDK